VRGPFLVLHLSVNPLIRPIGHLLPRRGGEGTKLRNFKTDASGYEQINVRTDNLQSLAAACGLPLNDFGAARSLLRNT
jgi:hypothetical protein